GIRDGHVTGVQTCALPISDGLQHRRSLPLLIFIADYATRLGRRDLKHLEACVRVQILRECACLDRTALLDLILFALRGDTPALQERKLRFSEIGRASCRERV